MPDTMLEEGLCLDRVVLVERIGKGGQAEVWKVRERDAPREVAAKLVVVGKERRSEINREVLDGEIQKLSVLNGNYVVIMHYAIYDLREDTGSIVLGYTMPIANGGTLETNIDYRKTLQTNRTELIQTMLSICRGIAMIHDRDFVHGDIKPTNILLFTERNLTFARVSDLGAAYFAKLGFGLAFDPRYAAPERFGKRFETSSNDRDKKRADIYSLGMLFFELITGRYAYGDSVIAWEDPLGGYHALHSTGAVDWDLVPPGLVRILPTLRGMLAKSPGDRPDIETVLLVLEGTQTADQVETTGGHRNPRTYFPKDVFNWNPKLHERFENKKKLFLIKTPNPFEEVRDINARLLEKLPTQGFTLYVSFGAADIVLSTWEADGASETRATIERDVQRVHGHIDEFAINDVQYPMSRDRESWSDLKSADLARLIIKNTSERTTEAELEDWLVRERLVFGRLTKVAKHNPVRLMLKIEAAKGMDREHDPILRSIRDFLTTRYARKKGKLSKSEGKLAPYPFRLYSDVDEKKYITTSKRWTNTPRRFLFVEIYGSDIYFCSDTVLGIIRALESNGYPESQHFYYSSYIQFDRENLSESEDGRLTDILLAHDHQGGS